MTKLFCLATGLCLMLACNDKPAETTPPVDSAVVVKETKAPPQSEIGDAKFTEIGKRAMANLSSGDIDKWMNDFADNASYRWSAGDSLVGKAAITKYWKERRGKIIDSLTYTNDIWLPLKVNTPQKGPDLAGNWLLGWSQVSAKYKNGKKLTYWVHVDYHFDASDKIDLVLTYIDRAPINRALGVK